MRTPTPDLGDEHARALGLLRSIEADLRRYVAGKFAPLRRMNAAAAEKPVRANLPERGEAREQAATGGMGDGES